MTYGNAPTNTMTKNRLIQNPEVHTSSFTMRCVEMRMTLVNEKNILNRVQANATSIAG